MSWSKLTHQANCCRQEAAILNVMHSETRIPSDYHKVSDLKMLSLQASKLLSSGKWRGIHEPRIKTWILVQKTYSADDKPLAETNAKRQLLLCSNVHTLGFGNRQIYATAVICKVVWISIFAKCLFKHKMKCQWSQLPYTQFFLHNILSIPVRMSRCLPRVITTDNPETSTVGKPKPRSLNKYNLHSSFTCFIKAAAKGSNS